MNELASYLEVLEKLPGIHSFQVFTHPSSLPARGFDARLKLQTEIGDRELLVEVFRSHLTHKTADHITAKAIHSKEPILILAPHIGAGLAAKLSDAGVNYLDANGNCHIATPPLYVHIEGRSAAPRPRADKGLRRAGYQVLFAYLAEPRLLNEPIRTTAEAAGVSRQPVADMRRRLLNEEYVLEAKTQTRWHPRRRQDALALWLHGYETTVRPSLIRGTYRTKNVTPAELEKRLTRVFSETGVPEFRWGGTAAGFRMTGHYRGERTVVHVHSMPGDLQKRLRALTDPRGNLIVMDAFGTINWDPEMETVHPLLVYSEMLSEGSERAREAAEDLYEKQLAQTWEQA